MAIVKRITDLSDFTTVLPYASELFGIYQPLIGWKSKRIEDRFKQAFKSDKTQLLESLKQQFTGNAGYVMKDNKGIDVNIKHGSLKSTGLNPYDSILLDCISRLLPVTNAYDPAIWAKLITTPAIDGLLGKEVSGYYETVYNNGLTPGNASGSKTSRVTNGKISKTTMSVFEHQLKYESAIGGLLLFLVKHKNTEILEQIFYHRADNTVSGEKLLKMLGGENAGNSFLNLDNINPQDKTQIQGATLSPISVVHLFRQYFFELDTFLGTPVNHVWLSPGATVELLEVHTRNTITERTFESSLDMLSRSENTVTTQDEISEAVKEDNQQDVKFGASVTASYASIEASSSFDYTNSQKLAREKTHKQMREQTTKLTSEIRKNFKSTFRTLTEVTDVQSTKHVLTNKTDELLNYEMRRKMRQVGVQVQDVGTYLCWQSYVDDPGSDLGISEMVHIAKSPSLDGLPHPEEIPLYQPIAEERTVTIPFISILNNADNEGEIYVNGVESDNSEFMADLEKIQSDFAQEFVSPKSGYELSNIEFDPQGKPVRVSRRGDIVNLNSRASFILHLDSADFQGQNSITVKVILHWSPLAHLNEEITKKNQENIATFSENAKAEYQKAQIETIKERIELASKITARKAEDLREEERIVIYRKLIQDMLLNGVPLPDDRSRHVVAEMINSIFDIDKMLYFVAPEWWRPRLHRSKQQLQESVAVGQFDTSAQNTGVTDVLAKGLFKNITAAENATKPAPLGSSTTGWGGVGSTERDNYYITENSDPAKLGSSLGWLMQLDGDNMRNAFLNAPWVKAVIPIRPGKEEAAINWLKGVEGMNGITDDVIYHASNPNEKDINGNPLEGRKMIDVLYDLGKKVNKKYQEGIETGNYPVQDELADPSLVDEENTVTATPIDRVYEHGFFPLQGGFRLNVTKNYEIFDQWIEILPTDQIVPVEVKYDPRTGRQIV